ncbi:unnamed protein product [Closterium sp. NIES-65]|nr:unnamed protein product [Closterium sp. NIES-65]
MGPGLWRLHASMVHKKGVRKIVEATVAKVEVTDGSIFKLLLSRLAVGLRAFAREEGKHVKATVSHLVDIAAELRKEAMRSPTCKMTSERLAAMGLQLREYQASRKDKLHLMSGMRMELPGEVASQHLTAMVQARKACTQISELQTPSGVVLDSQGIFRAASDFFADIFGKDRSQLEENWKPEKGKKLTDWEAAELAQDWTEEEVKKAFSAMAANKSPGKDGLPKELFEAHWDLLGKGFMALAKDFASSAVLSTEVKEAVTILLHKKGDKDQLNNYRPITLLNFTYKVLARVVADQMKKALSKVISPEQYGFLSGRRLTDAVGLVADIINTAHRGFRLWSTGLLHTPRELGGVGVQDPEMILACLTARRVGLLALETNRLKKHLMTRAADLPMGMETFFAHEKLLKHWGEKSAQWKAACENFMKTPLGNLLEANTREAVVSEKIVFNKRILLKGTTRVGGQKDAKPLWEKRLGDLLKPGSSGLPVLKDVTTLERELGGKGPAKLAVRAFEAAPTRWRDLLLSAPSQEGQPTNSAGSRQAHHSAGRKLTDFPVFANGGVAPMKQLKLLWRAGQKPSAKQQKWKERWNGHINCAIGVRIDELQVSFDELQVSSDELQVSSDKLQVSSDELQVSSDELQVSSDELQVSSDELQVSIDELQASSDELQVSSDEAQVSSDELQVSSGELQVSFDELRVSIDELQVSSDELQVSSDELQVSSDELQVSSGEFR